MNANKREFQATPNFLIIFKKKHSWNSWCAEVLTIFKKAICNMARTKKSFLCMKKISKPFQVIRASLSLIFCVFLLQQSVSASAKYERKCPSISEVQVHHLQCAPRKDGVSRACQKPTIFKIPLAYLNSSSRRNNSGSVLSISAAYEDLAPACMKYPSRKIKPQDRLSLHLTRHSNSSISIKSELDRTKNPKYWKRMQESALPGYDHYFNHNGISGHILIPKEDHLKTPYLVECLKPDQPKSEKILSECTLWVDYRHQVLLKVTFNRQHLPDIQEVHSKSIELLNRLLTHEP